MDLNRKSALCFRSRDVENRRYLAGIDADGLCSISRHEKHATGTMSAGTMLNGTVSGKKNAN